MFENKAKERAIESAKLILSEKERNLKIHQPNSQIANDNVIGKRKKFENTST